MPHTGRAYACESAVVTGGASGIGRAVAEGLATDGARIFVADLDVEAANRVADAICHDGGRAEAVRVDVADSQEVIALFAEVQKRVERLDLLVNCAGLLEAPAAIEDTTDDLWDRTIAVNLTGTFNCCREAVRWMKRHRTGRVINVASIAALTPTPGALPYAAAKAGVVQLSKSLARETAPHNLRVNVIAPGYVQTPMLDQLADEFKEGILRRTPLHRFASPSEIAAAVRFLVQADADYFTGQILSPNGGLVM